MEGDIPPLATMDALKVELRNCTSTVCRIVDFFTRNPDRVEQFERECTSCKCLLTDAAIGIIRGIDTFSKLYAVAGGPGRSYCAWTPKFTLRPHVAQFWRCIGERKEQLRGLLEITLTGLNDDGKRDMALNILAGFFMSDISHDLKVTASELILPSIEKFLQVPRIRTTSLWLLNSVPSFEPLVVFGNAQAAGLIAAYGDGPADPWEATEIWLYFWTVQSTNLAPEIQEGILQCMRNTLSPTSVSGVPQCIWLRILCTSQNAGRPLGYEVGAFMINSFIEMITKPTFLIGEWSEESTISMMNEAVCSREVWQGTPEEQWRSWAMSMAKSLNNSFERTPGIVLICVNGLNTCLDVHPRDAELISVVANAIFTFVPSFQASESYRLRLFGSCMKSIEVVVGELGRDKTQAEVRRIRLNLLTAFPRIKSSRFTPQQAASAYQLALTALVGLDESLTTLLTTPEPFDAAVECALTPGWGGLHFAEEVIVLLAHGATRAFPATSLERLRRYWERTDEALRKADVYVALKLDDFIPNIDTIKYHTPTLLRCLESAAKIPNVVDHLYRDLQSPNVKPILREIALKHDFTLDAHIVSIGYSIALAKISGSEAEMCSMGWLDVCYHHLANDAILSSSSNEPCVQLQKMLEGPAEAAEIRIDGQLVVQALSNLLVSRVNEREWSIRIALFRWTRIPTLPQAGWDAVVLMLAKMWALPHAKVYSEITAEISKRQDIPRDIALQICQEIARFIGKFHRTEQVKMALEAGSLLVGLTAIFPDFLVERGILQATVRLAGREYARSEAATFEGLVRAVSRGLFQEPGLRMELVRDDIFNVPVAVFIDFLSNAALQKASRNTGQALVLAAIDLCRVLILPPVSSVSTAARAFEVPNYMLPVLQELKEMHDEGVADLMSTCVDMATLVAVSSVNQDGAGPVYDRIAAVRGVFLRSACESEGDAFAAHAALLGTVMAVHAEVGKDVEESTMIEKAVKALVMCTPDSAAQAHNLCHFFTCLLTVYPVSLAHCMAESLPFVLGSVAYSCVLTTGLDDGACVPLLADVLGLLQLLLRVGAGHEAADRVAPHVLLLLSTSLTEVLELALQTLLLFPMDYIREDTLTKIAEEVGKSIESPNDKASSALLRPLLWRFLAQALPVARRVPLPLTDRLIGDIQNVAFPGHRAAWALLEMLAEGPAAALGTHFPEFLSRQLAETPRQPHVAAAIVQIVVSMLSNGARSDLEKLAEVFCGVGLPQLLAHVLHENVRQPLCPLCCQALFYVRTYAPLALSRVMMADVRGLQALYAAGLQMAKSDKKAGQQVFGFLWSVICTTPRNVRSFDPKSELSLSDMFAVLSALQKVKSMEEVRALVGRCPGDGSYSHFLTVCRVAGFGFGKIGREGDYWGYCAKCTDDEDKPAVRQMDAAPRCNVCKAALPSRSPTYWYEVLLPTVNIDCTSPGCKSHAKRRARKARIEYRLTCRDCGHEGVPIPSMFTAPAGASARKCTYCFSDEEPQLIDLGCGCETCVACFRQHAEIQIGCDALVEDPSTGQFTIVCANHGTPIKDTNTIHLLNARSRKRFDTFSLQKAAISNGAVICPLKGCANEPFFSGKHIAFQRMAVTCCPHCQGYFCARCVRACDECVCVDQAVECVGEEAEGADVLRSISYDNTDCLTVVIRSATSTFPLTSPKGETIQALRTRVREMIASKSQVRSIVYRGRVLYDEETLTLAGVRAGSTLCIVMGSPEFKSSEVRVTVARTVAEESSVRYIERSTRPCPRCKLRVAKFYNHGCHHITCQCNFQWCYLCGVQWGSECASRHHFCSPLQQCGCPICPECLPGKKCNLCAGCPACQIGI